MAVRNVAYPMKDKWRPEEDEELRKLVEKHGTRSWSVISESIPGRSRKSCRLRWCNQLSPLVDHRPFTTEEDDAIIRFHSELGNHWAAIARLLPGRTDNSVKNRWYTSLKRKYEGDDTGERSKRLRSRPGSSSETGASDSGTEGELQMALTHVDHYYQPVAATGDGELIPSSPRIQTEEPTSFSNNNNNKDVDDGYDPLALTLAQPGRGTAPVAQSWSLPSRDDTGERSKRLRSSPGSSSETGASDSGTEGELQTALTHVDHQPLAANCSSPQTRSQTEAPTSFSNNNNNNKDVDDGYDPLALTLAPPGHGGSNHQEQTKAMAPVAKRWRLPSRSDLPSFIVEEMLRRELWERMQSDKMCTTT